MENQIQSTNSQLTEILSLLNSQTKQSLNFTEACKYLDISKSYLYKLTSSNKIPYYKPNGKKIYFLKSDLDNWIMRNPIKSQLEMNIIAETFKNGVIL